MQGTRTITITPNSFTLTRQTWDKTKHIGAKAQEGFLTAKESEPVSCIHAHAAIMVIVRGSFSYGTPQALN